MPSGRTLLQLYRRTVQRSAAPWRRMIDGATAWDWSPGVWRDAALDLVFPPVCVDCGLQMAEPARPWHLCRACREQLEGDTLRPACPGCGLPRPAPSARSFVCPECAERRFRFQRVVALGLYRGHLRQAVVRMKQFHEFALTASVGALLVEQLKRQMDESFAELIVPIPKYWIKRLLRGSNTAERLAEAIACGTAGTRLVRVLRCRKSTRKQSLLGKTERQRNLSGAFHLIDGDGVRGANVLIVDDIMTTGATANEAARVLARAGARRITVAVVARAALGRQFPVDLARDALSESGS